MLKPPFEFLGKILDALLFLAFLMAFTSFVAEYGFYLPAGWENFLHRINIYIVWYFVLQFFLKLAFSVSPLQYIKSRWFELLLVVIILFETAVIVNLIGFRLFGKYLQGAPVQQITLIYIILFQVSILFAILGHAVRFNQKIASLKIHPSQILMGSFFIIIVLGTALLMLPRAVTPGNQISFVDALFTATSATCVTGLIVVDTGTYFSHLGQIIILVLIQIGGLGLMTFSSFFAFVLRRSISLKEKSMLKEILNFEEYGLISQLIYKTILFTFILEGMGAVFLFVGLSGTPGSLGEHIYSAIFHSVSAFCNAGFSLYKTSFMAFQQNYLVLFSIMILIVLGGLGFPVLSNLSTFKFLKSPQKSTYLSVQTRIVLSISSLLLIVGALAFFLLEYSNTLSQLSAGDQIVHSLFQSVTARTAGFNTVDIGRITVPMALIFLFLMFIGASPGSTGGGIKTTTFAILTAGVFSVMSGKYRIDMYHKTIPYTVLYRAMVIFFFSILFIFLIVFTLTLTQPFNFTDIVFEVFSAFGTVGLSRGITPELSVMGKIAITLCMFFGRLGALTISLAITTPRTAYHYDYPRENVMVG